MNARNYTNIALTAIATLLLVLVLQRSPQNLDPTPSAQAQSSRHIPQQITTDPALAAATKEVADANKEVARQIGEIAGSIKALSRSLDRAARMNN